MQINRATTAAALFVLFGALAPSYGQPGQDRENQAKPGQREKNQQQRPEARGQQEQRQQEQQAQRQQRRDQQQRVQQQQGRQQDRMQQQQAQQQQRIRQQGQVQRQQQQQLNQQARQSQQMNRTHQQAMAWQQQRGWARQGAWQGQPTWRQGRAERWATEHRNWQQRGGYGGYYIPQSRFSLSFGNQHYFRMQGRPNIYMGYPRFNYGGFSFLMLDRWPEYWGENWYDDDDVYIDYEDGYYLHNRRYPQVRLAITVVL